MPSKKPKKAAPQEPVTESAQPAPTQRVSERTAWLAGAPPWESYGRETSEMAQGLQGMLESQGREGETEVLIGTIEDAAKGKLKITHEKVPGADLREKQDGMLKWRTKNGDPASDKPLSEGSFDLGSADGGRVVFSADAFFYILLTDDQKYRAMQQSYKFHREDPVYRGLLNSVVNFVIGKGLKFKATDENPAVDAYVHEFWKLNKMAGKDREIVLRYFLTGEISARLLPAGPGGVKARHLGVKLIPFWRLAEVIKKGDDAEEIIGFRVWQASGPYRPQVKQDDVPPEEMLFLKNSTPEEDRGEPPFLACMRPCKWYQDWINNRVTLNRFRTSIVLFKKIIGGTPGRTSSVSSADPNATTAHQGLGGKIEKRLPKAGTVVTHNDKIEYDWKAPKLDATDAGADGRLIILYIACAAQVPEFLLGDASNANFASTFVAENPFIRQVEAWQSVFAAFFAELFQRVIEHGIKTGAIPKDSTETSITEMGWAARKVNQVLKTLGIKEAEVDDEGNSKAVKKVPTKTEVAIEWPNLLHKNQYEDAKTLQIHQQMRIASRETLSAKAGYDWEVEKPRLDQDAAEAQDEFEMQRQAEIDAGASAGDDEEKTLVDKKKKAAA